MCRLETKEGKPNFDVTTILNISKDRITKESETYNKKKFIEYDCVIDSTYCITIVRVGKMTNINLSDCLFFENQSFPSRNGWFNYDITSPAPYPIEGFTMPYIALYNVFLLPLKKVDKIYIFVDGKIIDKEYINGTIVSYVVESYCTTFSFNNINKCDLKFLYAKVKNPIPINIFFTIDTNRNLYIGCVSTNIGIPKTLSEIID